jgi:anti-sigma factor RsiW
MSGPSDEMLVAYADGELGVEEFAAVEAYLETDPVARDKVRALRETSVLLRAAYAPDEVQKRRAVRIFEQARRHSRFSRTVRAGMAAAAGVLLLAGAGVIGIRLQPDERVHTMAEVAEYHTLYAQETTHLVEVPASRQAELEEWLGARLHRTLAVPDLSGDGWSFEGGRMLAAGSAPIAQLLYSAPGRAPIALCITFSDAAESKPRQYIEEGMRMAAWDAAGYLYVIVGDLRPDEVTALTGRVRGHFGMG